MVPNENKSYFLNFLHKKGKKGKIEKFYNQLLFALKQQEHAKPTTSIQTSINALKPKLQLLPLSRFKFKICPVFKTKQVYLSFKWLTGTYRTAKQNKLQVLTTEILNTNKKKSLSYQQKINQYLEITKLQFTLRHHPKKLVKPRK